MQSMWAERAENWVTSQNMMEREQSGERAESAAHSLLSVGGERGDRIAAAAGKTSVVVVVVTPCERTEDVSYWL